MRLLYAQIWPYMFCHWRKDDEEGIDVDISEVNDFGDYVWQDIDSVEMEDSWQTAILGLLDWSPTQIKPHGGNRDTNLTERLTRALRNCLALALRHEMADDWAHVAKFCQEAGLSPSLLREVDP